MERGAGLLQYLSLLRPFIADDGGSSSSSSSAPGNGGGAGGGVGGGALQCGVELVVHGAECLQIREHPRRCGGSGGGGGGGLPKICRAETPPRLCLSPLMGTKSAANVGPHTRGSGGRKRFERRIKTSPLPSHRCQARGPLPRVALRDSPFPPAPAHAQPLAPQLQLVGGILFFSFEGSQIRIQKTFLSESALRNQISLDKSGKEAIAASCSHTRKKRKEKRVRD